MLTIRETAVAVAAMFAADRENAVATNEARKANWVACRDAILANCEYFEHSPATVANMVTVFANEAKARGLKSLKVRKSEFNRILSNVQHVPADCTSWKKALSAIREATNDRETLIREELKTINEKIAALYEKRDELLEELNTLGDDSDDVEFPDEVDQDEDEELAA